MNAHHHHGGEGDCCSAHSIPMAGKAAARHVDPVCGMEVTADSPHRASHDGRD